MQKNRVERLSRCEWSLHTPEEMNVSQRGYFAMGAIPYPLRMSDDGNKNNEKELNAVARDLEGRGLPA